MTEVSPDEEQRGFGEPAGHSPLEPGVVDALRKPLDPSRIRKREGRGKGEFSYLAGHDVKRRANEIFGPGNWGSRLLKLEEIAVVEVTSKSGNKPGFHVAYAAIVEVTVRECLPFSDVGYGDGVEYGSGSFATARELAIKEASTDALKRAFTPWGDQFGLILYAKADEKRRIEGDHAADDAESLPVPEAHPEEVAELKKLLREEGFSETKIEHNFGIMRSQNRGRLHPDYVAEQLEGAKKRLEEKRRAAA